MVIAVALMRSTARVVAILFVVVGGSGCSTLREHLLPATFDAGPRATLPPEARARGHFVKAEVALSRNDLARAVKEYEKAVEADPGTSMLRMRLATLYVRTGNLDGALVQAQKVADADPGNLEALELLAGAMSARGKDDEAVALYERVLAADPDRTEPYLYLGALYSRKGDVEKAVAALKKVVARNPGSVLGYYYLGRVYSAAKQFDKAEQNYLSALKLSPQSELVLTDLALNYELQGKTPKAVELYERVLALNPQSVVVRKRLGSIYVGQKRLDDAIAQYREVEKSDREDAHTKIGLIYLEKGDLERAGAEFDLVLAAEPTNHRVRYFLSSVCAERGEVDRAIDELAKIPPDSEYYVDARVRRAYLLQKEKPDEAIAELEQALKAKPDAPEIVSYLSSLYKERNEIPKAVTLLERLVVHFPENDKYHFMLGAMYDEAKNKPAVVEQMRKAIELNPKNAAALNYLGYTLAEQGNSLDEAESLIRRALELEPDDGFFVDSLGWVYYQRGDAKAAVKQLERAVELAGDDPTVIEHLGDAYKQAGRTPEALRAFRDALARSKDTAQTERLRSKIQTLEAAAQPQGSSL